MGTKLHATDNNIFVLNHNVLIKKSYFENSESEFIYKFKEDVFNFIKKNRIDKDDKKRKKPKKNPKIDSIGSNKEIGIKLNKESDKRNQEFILKFVSDIKIIEAITTNTLDKQQELLKMLINLTSARTPDAELNLILDGEINYSFPKMYGYNSLNEFKLITIEGLKYIIPPKSSYYNTNIENITEISFNKTFDFIVIDPPWRNKYIKRLNKSKFKSNSAYRMLYNNEIQNIPIENLINDNSLVIIWCTNSQQHQKAILDDFLPKWKLKIVSKFYWVKLARNEDNNIDLICDFNHEFGKKQPFEIFYVASSLNSKQDFSEFNKFNVVMSVPSKIHSHKPPLYEIFRKILINGDKSNCLELFARCLQPNFTSIGLEVLKLMDFRLYDSEKREIE